jgi:thiamine-monophosphate kinase
MSLGEFDLISRYLKQSNTQIADGVEVGIGDDCAILALPDGCQLAVTTDSLVCGVHFFEDVCPYRLGYKSLAVNLSDLAAMGADPKWVSLALTLPKVDEKWLSEFCRGFFDLALKHNVSLIGGDTTKGPLSITVSAKGVVPRHKAILRSGAQVGDLICVSGALGDGGLGLDCKTDKQQLNNPIPFIDALELTEPRNELGKLLVNYASSCIDISDGLIQDLKHILDASLCSAEIEVNKLPLSAAMKHEIKMNTVTQEQAFNYALSGGDDYELLFSINHERYSQFCSHYPGEQLTVIGKVVAANQPSIRFTESGREVNLQLAGWDHFK